MQILPHPAAKHQRLVARPPQHTREERQRRRLAPLQAAFLRVAPNLLEVVVLGPVVQRPDAVDLDHVDEAGAEEQILEERGDGDGAAHAVAGLHEEGRPLGDGGLGVHCAVLALEGEAVVCHFDVASWFEVAAGVGRELGVSLSCVLRGLGVYVYVWLCR